MILLTYLTWEFGVSPRKFQKYGEMPPEIMRRRSDEQFTEEEIALITEWAA